LEATPDILLVDVYSSEEGRRQMNENDVQTIEVDDIEGASIVDEAARRLLSISGDEFIRRWDAGETIDGDHLSIMKVAMLLPLAG
jgi:hypothetical protein